jgi:hypothetical protein
MRYNLVGNHVFKQNYLNFYSFLIKTLLEKWVQKNSESNKISN